MAQIEREGKVRFGDAALYISEEGISKARDEARMPATTLIKLSCEPEEGL